MILSDYIKQVLQNSKADKVDFDIGVFLISSEIVVDDGTFPNSPSPNRIKFTTEKDKPCQAEK